MAELKTKPTDYPVEEFIEKITPEWKKNDTKIIVQLMEDIIGEKPVMWGDSIIGFGKYHYKYETGREGRLVSYRMFPQKAKPYHLSNLWNA